MEVEPGDVDSEAVHLTPRAPRPQPPSRLGPLASALSLPGVLVPLGVSLVVLVITVVLTSGSRTRADPALPTNDFHVLFSESLGKARYVDLTHAVSPQSPVWPGFGPSQVAAGKAGVTMEGFASEGEEWTYAKHGFVTTEYHLVTDQLGTQLDPPAHWNEYGATISDIPATVALRPLVVIDVSAQTAEDPGYVAAVEDVERWEATHGRVPAGSVVFFRSDWSKQWAQYASEGLPATFPGVGLATLKHLHLNRSILMHGHEPLDTDMTPALEGEAWLMHNNFMQAEGVTNLHLVPETGCLVSIGFPRLQGGTGGYARYVAVCPEGSGGLGVDEAPGAPLPVQAAPLRRSSSGPMQPAPGAPPTEYCASDSAIGCANGKPVW